MLRNTTISASRSTVVGGPEAKPTETVVYVQSSDEHGSPVPFVAGSLIAYVTFAGPDPIPTTNHTFIEVSPGYYRASLTSATKDGDHRVDVVVVKGSAKSAVGTATVTVRPSDVSAKGSDLASLAAKYSAGAPGRFYVFTRDAWGNRVTSAAQLTATRPRFGVTITRDDGGLVRSGDGERLATALKLDATDVGGGAFLVSFTAATEPNVRYAVSVALCPPLTSTTTTNDNAQVGPTTNSVVATAPTATGAGCAGGIALTKSPWSFTTVGGALRSTCYRLTGDYLSAGFSAGWALFKVVFIPSAACGQAPSGPEPLQVTWTRHNLSSSSSSLSDSSKSTRDVLCEAPRLDGAECRLRIDEPTAGTYTINATLYGDVLAGAPATLVVRPAAPALRLAASPSKAASASHLRGIVGLPPNAPVPAGERLTIEAALVDRHGNPVLPDVKLFFGLSATLTTVAPAVNASGGNTTVNATTGEEALAEAAAAAAAEGVRIHLRRAHARRRGSVSRRRSGGDVREEVQELAASVFVFDERGGSEGARARTRHRRVARRRRDPGGA